MRYNRVDWCANGRLRGARTGRLYAGAFWRFRFNRCDSCRTIVLPHVVRWFDVCWYRTKVAALTDDLRFYVKNR